MLYSTGAIRPIDDCAEFLPQPASTATFLPFFTAAVASRRIRLRRGTAGLVAAAALLVMGHSSAHAAAHRHAHRTAHQARRPGAPAAPDDAAAPIATEYSATWQQVGVASYYGPRHHGRRTASGTTFDQTELTAAHRWLPFGTRVRVTAQGTGREVIVTITDRCPARSRVIDLSVGAASALGILHQGTAVVVLSAT